MSVRTPRFRGHRADTYNRRLPMVRQPDSRRGWLKRRPQAPCPGRASLHPGYPHLPLRHPFQVVELVRDYYRCRRSTQCQWDIGCAHTVYRIHIAHGGRRSPKGMRSRYTNRIRTRHRQDRRGHLADIDPRRGPVDTHRPDRPLQCRIESRYRQHGTCHHDKTLLRRIQCYCRGWCNTETQRKLGCHRRDVPGSYPANMSQARTLHPHYKQHLSKDPYSVPCPDRKPSQAHKGRGRTAEGDSIGHWVLRRHI